MLENFCSQPVWLGSEPRPWATSRLSTLPEATSRRWKRGADEGSSKSQIPMMSRCRILPTWRLIAANARERTSGRSFAATEVPPAATANPPKMAEPNTPRRLTGVLIKFCKCPTRSYSNKNSVLAERADQFIPGVNVCSFICARLAFSLHGSSPVSNLTDVHCDLPRGWRGPSGRPFGPHLAATCQSDPAAPDRADRGRPDSGSSRRAALRP